MEVQATFPRRRTRQVMVGDVAVGGDAPISVQSMTTTKTADVEGTLAQIYALAAAGADIVRCTCNEIEAAEGLAEIVPRSPVPIVADIHHQYRMALAALEANVACLRLNPGNIRRPEHIKAVAAECRDRGVPIRIGVNGGSLHPDLYARYGGKVTAEAMVESALDELAYFAEVDFDLVKISVKASSVPLMIDAYRQLAEVTDHPLHLGVTEAGPPPAGVVKSTAGIATLLAEGIGDTIRYSLTADPVTEARAGRTLLESLGLRERRNVDLIACPSCGRAEVDVFKIAEEALEAFGEREIPLQVAVMGCVVNGPGEARDADLGIAAGRGRGHLFVKGQNVAVVPEDEMVESLVSWAELICAEGVEAALARADTERASREAERDRTVLLDTQGEDANEVAARVDIVRRAAGT
ncbi:MAG: flavodoxin-dependent (E)-4-hydroxy-3-methylbut-2-enyl-diphosphate synthase [bacterium]|nr:flavodoxin-dependent (E)-4-hydroxy-3-methylbut-2-enyl-diphosphate synthase [bacterium]MCY3953228.1 flavodoxin-dependent (E)-4-hydroxy-3-methylbut-2-enyl-diphosphate synthase [bacterium]MCY4102821.1 flavodoxin-dependent (E)-4-hydroxy-3-methylbut-2-enyl-diphosphate synthase [bacterium]